MLLTCLCQSIHSFVERAVDGQVPYVSGCLVGQVLCKIDNSEVVSHVFSCNIFDPSWNGGGKQTDLDLSLAHLSALAKDLVDILFASELEHDICFVENKSLDI